MSLIWHIKGSDGFQARMPGCLHDSEILRALQRLACLSLSRDQIIQASLRRGFHGYSPLLERIGIGAPLHVGADTFYTAARMGT